MGYLFRRKVPREEAPLSDKSDRSDESDLLS